MADDLFAASLEERLTHQAPLATRMRPRVLSEVAGQRHLLESGRPLRALIESDRLSSVIFWGPPGTGKTTVARVIAEVTAKAFEPMSAVTAGVKEVREVVGRSRRRLAEQGQATILFLDEIHRFNRTQQDALLPHVEDGTLVLIGATTENPYFSVNAPLMSRSTLFRFEEVSAEELAALIDRAMEDPDRGLGGSGLELDGDARRHLTDRAQGDARQTLIALEVAAALTQEAGRPRITLEDAEAAMAMRAIRYGEDEHYDVISAFIKSIRGSDPDAGLYWLARMLEAGEDPRYIARRLVILASEDVGLADPLGLVVANAAAQAVEFVGLPEAQLNLAQAVVHLAMAPKSNSIKRGVFAARQDVQDTAAGLVPVHLRDASYKSGTHLGHGEGYVYPHDLPEGWVAQQHRPPEVEGHRYYDPSPHGEEAAIGERLAWLREAMIENPGGERRDGGEGPSGGAV